MSIPMAAEVHKVEVNLHLLRSAANGQRLDGAKPCD